MKKNYLIVLALFLLFVENASAQSHYVPFSIDVINSQNIPSSVSDQLEEALILDLNSGNLAEIIKRKDEKITVGVPVNRQKTVTLELNKFDLLTPGARVVAGTNDGDKEIDIKNRFAVYMGSLDYFDKATAVFAFFDDFAAGLLITTHDTYVLGKTDAPGLLNKYVLFQTSKSKVLHGYDCGSDVFGVPQRILELQRSLRGNFDNMRSATLLKSEMAIESDYDTYVRFGSVENATKYLLSLMAMVSAVYIKDVNVRITIPYIRVWSTSSDPYTGTTSFQLLSEFRAYWNANMQGVARTTAHYISTRPGSLGGVAWLDVLCASLTSGYGYAFSDIDGTFNNLPGYSWDVDVVAHETGHNFGSPHTHNCGWAGGPIDTCYQVEGGCYNGPIIPRVGTIMSYCHLNAGKNLIFGPLPSELIRVDAESAPCIISDASFYLAMPNGGQVLYSGSNVLVIWGTSTTGNVNVEYTTNNGSNWLTIQNNVPAVSRQISWSVPYIPTTTQSKVRVYESGNPANGDASDSTFQIRPRLSQFNLLAPPQLTTLFTSPEDTTVVNFVWTKSGTLPELKYSWWFSNMPYTLNLTRQSNNSGSDSIFTTRIKSLDSIAASWGVVIGDSIRCRWYVRVHSQLDSMQSNPGNFLITIRRQIVGVEPISSRIPVDYYVNQNYPNPFNPVSKIEFGLPKQSFVKINIYDITGREVTVLVNNKLDAGTYEVSWQAGSYPSGVYFYRIEASQSGSPAGAFVETRKMVLVK